MGDLQPAQGREGRHRHRDPIELPDGTVVSASSYRKEPVVEGYDPTFGVYLDHRWETPWTRVTVDWPDFGVPTDTTKLTAALREALDRARRGELVEVGCLGGHGRTGTAIACLAVLAGLNSDPVDWVRAAYCDRAVETAEQEEFARKFATTAR
jgi:protein-tyrosine phosphatase